MTEERCVSCGSIIPEGRQVCPNCENGYNQLIEKFITEIRGFGVKKASKVSGVGYNTLLSWVNKSHAPTLDVATKVASAIGMKFLLFEKEG